MSDIFISYSRADRPRAEVLFEVLSAQGWSVWWDRDLMAGDLYDDVIDDQLRRSRCVLVLWSEASIGSRWVRAEAAEGLERGVLVPVQLDPVRLPLEFRRLQTVSLMAGLDDAAGLADLIAGVRRLVGTGSVRDEDAIVRVECPSCGTSNKAPARMAGRKGKCRQCGVAIVVPGTPPVAEATPIVAEEPVTVIARPMAEPVRPAAGGDRSVAGRDGASRQRPSRATSLGIAAVVLVALGLAAAAGGLFDRTPREDVQPVVDPPEDPIDSDDSRDDEQARLQAAREQAAADAERQKQEEQKRATQKQEAQKKADDARKALVAANGHLNDAEDALREGDLGQAAAKLALAKQAVARGVDRDLDVDLGEFEKRLATVRKQRDEGERSLAALRSVQPLRALCAAMREIEAFAKASPEAAAGLEIDAGLRDAQLRHDQLLGTIAGSFEGLQVSVGSATTTDAVLEVLFEIDKRLDELPDPLECKHSSEAVKAERTRMVNVLENACGTYSARLAEQLPAVRPWLAALAHMKPLADARAKLVSREGRDATAGLGKKLAEHVEKAAEGESTEQGRAQFLVALTEQLEHAKQNPQERLDKLASTMLGTFERSPTDVASAEARLEQLDELFPNGLAASWDDRLDDVRNRCQSVVDKFFARFASAKKLLASGDVAQARSLYAGLVPDSEDDPQYSAIARLGLVECDRSSLPSSKNESHIKELERLIRNYREVERLGDFVDLDQVSIPAKCSFRSFELYDEILEVYFDVYKSNKPSNRNIINVNNAKSDKLDAFKSLEAKYRNAKDRDGRLFVDMARAL